MEDKENGNFDLGSLNGNNLDASETWKYHINGQTERFTHESQHSPDLFDKASLHPRPFPDLTLRLDSLGIRGVRGICRVHANLPPISLAVYQYRPHPTHDIVCIDD